MAGKYDFTIYQGATFSKVFTWRDSSKNLINLTGYTAVMYIKEDLDSTTKLLTSEGTSPTITLTLGGVLGTITAAITAAVTGALSFDKAIYVLELTLSGTTKRLLEGEVKLSRR